MSELGIQVKERLNERDSRYFDNFYLDTTILPTNRTILYHGGGNFGDLYPEHMDLRHAVMSRFPYKKHIIFPQTINYRNISLARVHSRLFASLADLTIMTRSEQSYKFARYKLGLSSKQTDRVLLMPDMAFMIGAIRPRKMPRVDILILARIDFEASEQRTMWLINMRKLQLKHPYLTYLLRDWFDYSDVVTQSSDIRELAAKRVDLGNEILSLGRVVVTDRLHASILSLLMGKPHVMINDRYRKVELTRTAAFENKTECTEENLRGFYAVNIEDGLQKALWLLNSLAFV